MPQEKPRPQAKALPEDWLQRKLTQTGKKAFDELCRWGCDRRILGNLFALLVAKPISSERPRPSASMTQAWKATYHSINPHPLDTLEGALHRSGKIDTRALQRTAQRARQLAKEIDGLRRTPLVIWLVEKGCIQDKMILIEYREKKLWFNLHPAARRLYEQNAHIIEKAIARP